MLAAVVVVLLVAVTVIVFRFAGGSSGKNASTNNASGATSTASSGTVSSSSGAKSGSKVVHQHESVAQTIAETGKLPAGDMPAIEAGLLPWTLNTALSRAVAVSGPGAQVSVIGGLTQSQTTVPTIVSVNTANGDESPVGALSVGVHDASASLLGHNVTVFGGGSPDTVATVQQFSVPTTIPVPAQVSSTLVGSLPQPRSDSSAVTIGRTAYVVGGYTGSGPLAQVLATTDGKHYTVVTSLPLSVRYPAVAALDGKIYLFGGEAVGGPHDGSPTDSIQMVDPASKTARVVGRLPTPLTGAAAAVLDGHIYIAGGTEGAPYTATSAVWAYNESNHRLLNAGSLPAATSYAAVAVDGGRAWIFGGENQQQPMSSVEMLTPNPRFGAAGMVGAGSPYFAARLLVADRGNNRLLLLDTNNRIGWTYPSASAAAPPGGFYFPDDAFFVKHGTEILSNQEENHTIVLIGFPSGQLIWQYGHPMTPGSAAGYLHQPDDAYQLKNGVITVADAENCRILFINPNKTVASQIGTDGVCQHNPPSEVGYPNGDTPLQDGNVLVSEIHGSWISEYTPSGKLVWTVQLPSIGYVSDPQQIGPDRYLVSDYSDPGAIVEFNRAGQILYRYSPNSGPGALNQPSLTELLPSGVLMTNDDYRHRMAAIDPATQALVWQYGVTDQPGTAPGMLNTPDGFDILMPDGSTPTHPFTG